MAGNGGGVGGIYSQHQVPVSSAPVLCFGNRDLTSTNSEPGE